MKGFLKLLFFLIMCIMVIFIIIGGIGGLSYQGIIIATTIFFMSLMGWIALSPNLSSLDNKNNNLDNKNNNNIQQFLQTEQGQEIKKKIDLCNFNIKTVLQTIDTTKEEVVVSQLEFENVLLRPYEYLMKRFNLPISEKFCDELREQIKIYEYINEQIEKIKQLNVEYEGQLLQFDDMVKEVKYKEYIFYNQSTRYYNRYKEKYDYVGKLIECNIETINDIIKYIEQRLNKVRQHNNQRKLMTPELREQVLIRDNYTCQKCGISKENEPNLLLEVDHIVPVSKGGITELDNLQTLCWKCNRQKGSK